MAKAAQKPKAKKTKKVETVVAYKGFDSSLSCRDFQYEVGKTYQVRHRKVPVPCEGPPDYPQSFHACENPLDCFSYYPPGTSRYCRVAVAGKMARHDSDSKIAAAKITIETELTLPEFIQRGVEFILSKVVFDTAKESNTGYRSAATNTGDQSAATNTGDRSAATNTGHRSAATNTGDRSAATNTGDQSAATVEGDDSIAIASGYEGKAAAAKGSALCLVERDDNYKITAVWAGIAGKGGIKPDAFYTLKNGKPVEAAGGEK